jgi:glycosyltransferase involved in cell wall biosynthesis
MEIVVAIPCYNESKTITKVVQDFKKELPQAKIIVFDNDSTDGSAQLARNSGAEVMVVKQRGKGNVVGKIFEVVASDFYILVDGDDTYSAKDVHKLMQPVLDGEADMVVGRRIVRTASAMKSLNKIGNNLFSKTLSFCLNTRLKDVFSGYRVFNKEFVANVPVLYKDFEVEAEMTLQAISKGMRIKEVEVDYKERPQGSFSKLSIWRDGYIILSAIVELFRDLKPLTFFSLIAFVVWLLALFYGLIVYYSPRVSNILDAIILTSLAILGWLFVIIGLSLHTINRRFTELIFIMKKMKEKDQS